MPDSGVLTGTAIYFGAYVKPAGPTASNWVRGALSDVTTFEQEVGKGLSVWNWFQYRDLDPDFSPTWIDESRIHGSSPLITWAPSDRAYAPLVAILNGDFDA